MTSWKQFYSTTGTKDPVIGFTWNRPPAKPATVEPSEAVVVRSPG